MEIGAMVTCAQPKTGDPSSQFDHLMNQCRTAIDNNYDSIFTGQHYLDTAYNRFQSIPVLSRVSGMDPDINLGTAIFLLPFHHPVFVAEHFSTLSHQTNANVYLGVGLAYKDREFDAFGIDKSSRVGRLVEGIQLIRKLWTEDNVSFDGDYYQVEDITVNSKPDDAEIWIGALSPTSVKRAAKLGEGWISTMSYEIGEGDVQDLFDIYNGLTKEGEYSGKAVINTEAVVADTTEEARQIARPEIKRRIEFHLDHTDMADDYLEQNDIVEEAMDRRVIGTPEECIQQIEDYKRELNFDHMVINYNMRDLPQDTSIEIIRKFGADVIPHVKSR